MAAERTGEVEAPVRGSRAAPLRVDARPAVLLAQFTSDGTTYLTSRSTGGDTVHLPVPEAVETSSYRIDDSLTVEADRTSNFVVVTRGGQYLVVAFNEGVRVRPDHDGGRRLPLAPHEAVLAIGGNGVGIRVVSAEDADPSRRGEVAALLDLVVESMTAPVVSPTPVAGPGDQAGPPPDAPQPFGRYLIEMLLTGVAIAVVLAVFLLVIG